MTNDEECIHLATGFNNFEDARYDQPSVIDASMLCCMEYVCAAIAIISSE